MNSHENFSFIVTQLTSPSSSSGSQNKCKWNFQWRKPRTVAFSVSRKNRVMSPSDAVDLESHLLSTLKTNAFYQVRPPW